MPLNEKLRRSLVFIALVAGVVSAHAQGAAPAPATENVTVTGLKDIEAAVGKFVGAMTAPTRAAGKIARWKDGVCPLAVGVRPEIANLLTRRIREVAAQAGAPVNNREACPHNIEIIFTTAPQVLLDNIRVMHPILLGTFDNSAQAENLATMRSPIQSWYITATVDLHGQVQVDGGRKGGVSMTMAIPQAGFGGPATGAPDMITMNMPDAGAASVSGTRLGDGVSSAITNVVIVADTSKLVNRDAVVLADYIAMLALAQIQPPTGCQALPSILNLLVPDCSRTASALTPGDLAFLQALYKITTTTTVYGQRSEMMYQMNKALSAGK
jgi:hypothetical protein